MLVGYCRVSTSRQNQSLEAQREALIAAGCDSEHIYADTVSGAKWQRPGLNEAKEFLRDGDSLVVTRLDRLGRSISEMVHTVADLSEQGINLLVLEPELDTSSSNGKLMVHVLASLAEWERDLLRERTKDGVAYARSQGRYPGRKPKMSPEQAHTAQRLIEDGHSYSAVARGFNVSRPTLYRALERAKKAQRESATP